MSKKGLVWAGIALVALLAFVVCIGFIVGRSAMEKRCKEIEKFVELGEEACGKNDAQQAVEQLTRAEELMKALEEDGVEVDEELKAQLYYDLAWAHYSRTSEGHPNHLDVALYYVRNFIRILSKEIEIEFNVPHGYYIAGLVSEAKFDEIITASNTMFAARHNREMLDDAIRYYEQALDCEGLDNKFLSDIYYSLGGAHETLAIHVEPDDRQIPTLWMAKDFYQKAANANPDNKKARADAERIPKLIESIITPLSLP